MLKKSLIGVVLVALMAVPAFSGHLKRYDWPVEFVALEIPDLEIPVFIDVGLMVEIVNQKDLKKGFTLTQTDFGQYEGCITVEVKCNYDLILGASMTLNALGEEMKNQQGSKTKITVTIDDPSVPATLCDTVAERELCVKITGLSIVHVPYGKKQEIGTVTLNVKPAFDAMWEDP